MVGWLVDIIYIVLLASFSQRNYMYYDMKVLQWSKAQINIGTI